LVAVWLVFILLLILLSLPYITLYFLPYGFGRDKSFAQMPLHIIIIGHISNLTVFSFPVIVSVVVYVKLTREGQRRKLERQQDVFSVQTLPARPRADTSESNSLDSGGYTVDDLPYPLIVSITVYIKLRNEVWKRKLERQQDVFSVQTLPARPRADTSESNSLDSGGYTVNDLPYPLNVVQESSNRGQSSDQQFGNLETLNNLPPIPSMPKSKSTAGKTGAQISSNSGEPNAEIEATLRSMKTNFLMLLLFLLIIFIGFIPSPHWKMFVGCFVQSLIKFFLPIVTTISNFGPVKKVVKAYLENLKEKWTHNEH
jgi:hypothetical protein